MLRTIERRPKRQSKRPARGMAILIVAVALIGGACSGGEDSGRDGEQSGRIVADGAGDDAASVTPEGDEITDDSEGPATNDTGGDDGSSATIDPSSPATGVSTSSSSSSAGSGSTDSSSGASSQSSQASSVPLKKTEVRVTFKQQTKTSDTSVSFEVAENRNNPLTYEAVNGASVDVASVTPANKCIFNQYGFRLNEDTARSGDVCVVKLAVAAQPGYQASEVLVNIVGSNNCFITWSIKNLGPSPVAPGADVDYEVIQNKSPNADCTTGHDCSSTNLVDVSCHSGPTQVASDACARGQRVATLTVFGRSSGTYLWDEKSATTEWRIDCSKATTTTTSDGTTTSNSTATSETTATNETASSG